MHNGTQRNNVNDDTGFSNDNVTYNDNHVDTFEFEPITPSHANFKNIRTPSNNVKSQTHSSNVNNISNKSNIDAKPRTKPAAPSTYNQQRRNIRGLNDNLRSQTPLSRTMRKKNAPIEPGTVRRDNAPQHFKVRSDHKHNGKPKAKKNASAASFILVIGAVMYAILVPIIVLCVSIALPKGSSAQTNDYTYQLGPNKNVYSSKVYDYTRVRIGGEFYINMDSLAEYCSLTTTGDDKRIRYVVRSSGEYVEFVISESIAYINGVSERTGGNIHLKNGVVYVPLSFAQRCFNGIEIQLDETKNKITIVRSQASDGEYVDLSFPYKLPDLSGSINFADLDAEIQEIIIMQNQPPQDDGSGDGIIDKEN